MIKIFKFKFAIGIVLFLVGLSFIYKGFASNGSFMITMGLVLMISNYIYIKRGENYYKKDERTKKIAAYSAFYSWMVTIIFVSIIYMIIKLGYISLSSIDLISFIMLLMVVSLYGFYFYFNSKGDIQ